MFKPLFSYNFSAIPLLPFFLPSSRPRPPLQPNKLTEGSKNDHRKPCLPLDDEGRASVVVDQGNVLPEYGPVLLCRRALVLRGGDFALFYATVVDEPVGLFGDPYLQMVPGERTVGNVLVGYLAGNDGLVLDGVPPRKPKL